MKKQKTIKKAEGSSYKHMNLSCDLETLIEALGNPTKLGSLDKKVQIEWVFQDEGILDQEVVITIYDYKERKSINDIKEWHIGGKNISKEDIVSFMEEVGLSPYILYI
jgi:hypothetical protein